MEKAEAEKLQVVMAAQGDAEAKYLQGQARRHAFFASSFRHLLPVHSLQSQCLYARLKDLQRKWGWLCFQLSKIARSSGVICRGRPASKAEMPACVAGRGAAAQGHR